MLVTGVEDPDTRAHGANEGLHLAEFERVVLAEALLLRNLARADALGRRPASGRGGQADPEGAAPAELGLDLDPAVVPLDDPLHDRQAQAGAGLGDRLGVGGAEELGERAAPGRPRRDADALVGAR